ncbi:hypothetical protein HOK51_10510 [Candidatus Woesearchaeota archaeon]|jgi:hypothetical protein|nr:hypothetical protein [Candidatus Woesearchaeota archaeon]MBT6520254.1 hypothetical protein [Candidatus Woesearchaeota archaeon]MBT7368022.1 hypothetical protein [Candidatus Woesearchaeota archaeon]
MVQSATLKRSGMSDEEIEFLVDLINPHNENYKEKTKEQLLNRLTDYYSLVESRTDLNDELFIPIKNREDYQHFMEIHRALSLATRFDQHFKNFEDFLKKDTKNLGITLSDTCDKFQNKSRRCSHCVAGKGNNKFMDLDKLKNLDKKFFDLFKHAAFGRTGEPMLYKFQSTNQNGNLFDFSDAVEFIVNKTDIPEVSFFLGVFNKNNPNYKTQTKKLTNLKKLKKGNNKHFVTGLTYHPFAPDKELFEESFKYEFNSCFEFSDEINIDLLTSEVLDDNAIDNLTNSFGEFEKDILKNYELVEKNNQKYIKKNKNNRLVEYVVKNINTRVFDLGYFHTTLKDRGLLEKYQTMMGPKSYPPICVSTLKHNFIVIEPDGGVKTCVSFDGVNKPTKFNLFDDKFDGKEGYDGMVSWLEHRFNNQREEIIQNLPKLIQRNYSMCDCK